MKRKLQNEGVVGHDELLLALGVDVAACINPRQIMNAKARGSLRASCSRCLFMTEFWISGWAKMIKVFIFILKNLWQVVGFIRARWL